MQIWLVRYNISLFRSVFLLALKYIILRILHPSRRTSLLSSVLSKLNVSFTVPLERTEVIFKHFVVSSLLYVVSNVGLWFSVVQKLFIGHVTAYSSKLSTSHFVQMCIPCSFWHWMCFECWLLSDFNWSSSFQTHFVGIELLQLFLPFLKGICGPSNALTIIKACYVIYIISLDWLWITSQPNLL
jgi:hypothetical protein